MTYTEIQESSVHGFSFGDSVRLRISYLFSKEDLRPNVRRDLEKMRGRATRFENGKLLIQWADDGPYGRLPIERMEMLLRRLCSREKSVCL